VGLGIGSASLFVTVFSADWQSLARVAVFATAGYIALLALIRLLGSRAISKMNPSDFAITVAAGSLLANLILSKDASLLEGLVGLAVLLGLQFVTEWISARSTRFRSAVEGVPALLFYEGRFIRPALLREHVTETAVYKAIREQGISDIEQVQAVILEIDGSFSVISGGKRRTESALDDVRRAS
jgi:uncharacterized membrane protein YcaP (DUF421 family)